MPPERTGKIEAGSKPLFYPYRNAKFVLRDHFILIRMYIIKKTKNKWQRRRDKEAFNTILIRM